MCQIFSGHVVADKGKDWGKVLVVTGVHHEVDREKIGSKYKKLVAWETIESCTFKKGVKAVHDCGSSLGKKETNKLLKFALQYGKDNLDYLFKLVSKDEDCSVRCGVAGNSNTPVKVLEYLSKDEDYSVRCGVAGNGKWKKK